MSKRINVIVKVMQIAKVITPNEAKAISEAVEVTYDDIGLITDLSQDAAEGLESLMSEEYSSKDASPSV